MNYARNARFPHQRLDAYRVAVLLEDGVIEITERFARGHAELKSQMRRAAGATVRNLAEGADRSHPRDKANRFGIALGECGETDACLERALRSRLSDPMRITELRSLAARVGAMLRGLERCQLKRLEEP